MKLFKRISMVVTLSLTTWISASFAEVKVVELDNYSDIVTLVETLTEDYTKKSTQVVFDIDDTVIKYNECDAVKHIEKKFVRFMVSISKCDAVVTSPLVVDLIEDLKEKKYPVMAMTARGYKFGGMFQGTYKQLENLKEEDGAEETADLDFTTAIQYSDELVIIPFQQPLKNGELRDKEVAYKNGVGFVTSANKGLALKAFNKHMRKRFKNIIFVDDNVDNIDDLTAAYSGTKKNVTLVYYTEYSKAHEEAEEN